MTSSRVKEVYDEARKAREKIDYYIHKTPLMRSATFSRMANGDVFLKLENLQKTGAFKIRGALNACLRAKAEGKRVVVTSSSGNHAQGVAYAASILGLEAHIFMPEFTFPIKVEATGSYGAEVHLIGESYDESCTLAKEYASERGASFIHAFDEMEVIAGQGTIGLELSEQLPSFDLVIAPVGGGGLVSGLGCVVKNLRQGVGVIGVQSSAYPAFFESFKRREIVEVTGGVTIADGISVKRPGDLTFNIALEVVDDMVTVNDDEIRQAIFMLLERSKLVAEPAGAAALAAVISGKIDARGKRAIVIVSGGNISPLVLSRVISQSLRKSGRLLQLSVIIPDRPGSLRNVLSCVASARANIVFVEHIRDEPEILPSMARVKILMEAPADPALQDLTNCLRAKGLEFNIL